MDMIGRTPPAPLPAARIREQYAHTPTSAAYAMAWEIWRLQRVVIALDACLLEASSLRHRQDVIDRVTQLRAK